MIRARGLTKRYGEQAVLDRLDLDVQTGERIALLGLNGAGKTTFVRCALGLVPFEGDLKVLGFDAAKEGREIRTRTGYVPQRVPWFEGRLEEVVAFFARLRGVAPTAVEKELQRLGLDYAAHREKPVRALSGGMLQKVLLSLALASDVQLLLLDEPTANLDAPARRDFLEALRQVDRNVTIVLASHRLGDVRAIADRIVVLHRGRIAFDGSVARLEESLEQLSVLWLRPAAKTRERLLQELESLEGLSLRINGIAVGVGLEPGRRMEFLSHLALRGVEIDSFWSDR
jgi:ABC-2 type transport system ATP-binding protein